MQDEERIARGLQKGDPEAWSSVYEEYFTKIYRYIAIRVGNNTEAEDLAGQVFLKALESSSSFKWRGAPVSAWLFRIAHNQVIDYWRTVKSKAPLPLGEYLPSDGIDPVAEVERNINMRQVVQAMDKLTQAQRDVIGLRFAGGLSVAEAARVLGKSEGAVKVMQHSALAALRKRLQSRSDNE